MDNGFVNKRLEIRASEKCNTCKEAIIDLTPIAMNKKISINIIPAKKTDDFIPVICMVEEGDAVEHTTCVKGYASGVKSLLKDFLES